MPVCHDARSSRIVRRLSARVSDEARRGWDKLLDRHGVSFTAVIEATGRALDERDGKLVYEPDDVIEVARSIDRERFKRR